MKKLFVSLAICAVSLSVYATDLVNKDSVVYRVEIKKDSSTRTETSVSINSTYPGILKKGYVVKNLKTGETVTVTTDKKLIIKNGKFVQE
ncbi:MAG: hypothetical protein KAZ87_08380 [Spirochaetes bacterium]|nr:hypothetical protein [Spirochaetota bacterium]